MTLYEKIVTLGASFRASLRQKADLLDFAPLFNAAESYVPGRMVVYGGGLYVCRTAHSGAWDATHFSPATVDDAVAYRARLLDLAPAFAESADYQERDLVVKDGKLKTCTSAGRGSAANFQDATVEDAIDAAESALQSAMSLKAALLDLAPELDIHNSYEVGQLAVDNGALKRCVTAGYGISANFAPATVDDAISLVRNVVDYTSAEQNVSASTSGQSLALQNRTFNTVSAASLTGNISVTMPVMASSSSLDKVSDVLLRVDTGSSVPTLVFDTDDNVFIPTNGDPEWADLTPSAYNIFTFTYAGRAYSSPSRSVWVVGRVIRART